MMQTHSFVHLGDLHLRPDARNAQRLQVLDSVIDEALQIDGLAAWLWPGDLNHGRMSIDDRNALADRIQLMSTKAPVVICYGNHDQPGDLDVFRRLSTLTDIHVLSRPGVVNVPLATGVEAAIFVLPYPTKGALVAAGAQGEGLRQDARGHLDAIFADAAGRLNEARARGEIPLMIGHINVAGSIASVGQPQFGKEIELDQALLARLGPIYCGLNHIHKAQQVGPAWYAGSTFRQDWGEVEDKRYLVIEYQRDGTAWEHRVGSRLINVPPMWHVEGTYNRSTDDTAVMVDDEAFSWQVKAGPDGAVLEAPESWADAEVRVRFRFPAAKRGVLDEPSIESRFHGASRLVLEPIAVADQALRAPAVAAAKTLVEKLEAWADFTGLPFTDAQRSKLFDLEIMDPVALLQRVTQRLDHRPGEAETPDEKPVDVSGSSSDTSKAVATTPSLFEETT